jgi:hypothetical protein
MHVSDGPSYRFAVEIPKGAHHLRGPNRLSRDRFGAEQRIEHRFGDEAVRARKAVDQREWIRLRPPLATADRVRGAAMVTRLRNRCGWLTARMMPTCPPHALPTQSTGSLIPS